MARDDFQKESKLIKDIALLYRNNSVLLKIRRELQSLNQSAVKSLDEGLEKTLTLHRLGLFKELGVSLKTTNSLESINAHLERLTRKVTYWRNSSQRQRWLASALLEIELNLQRIKGYRNLPQLQMALQRNLKIIFQP